MSGVERKDMMLLRAGRGRSVKDGAGEDGKEGSATGKGGAGLAAAEAMGDGIGEGEEMADAAGE